MHKCTLCGQELPDGAFYPSMLKKRDYECKKCMYERYGKKSIRKYQEGLKQLPAVDFERYNGGLKITVLNYVKPYENKFNIKATSGEYFGTDNKEQFLNKLNEYLQMV